MRNNSEPSLTASSTLNNGDNPENGWTTLHRVKGEVHAFQLKKVVHQHSSDHEGGRKCIKTANGWAETNSD